MTTATCAHCHYSFSAYPHSPCKCRLCLDPSNHNVKAFMRKQQAIGYRICKTEVDPSSEALSDSEIIEKIEAQAGLLKASVECIFEQS